MKSLIVLLIFSSIAVSCKKDTVTPDPEQSLICDTTHPLEDLPWLKSEIAAVNAPSTIADYYVMRAAYKGRTVIWINICCPVCDTLPPKVRYCDGSLAGQLAADIRNDELEGMTEMWRTHNGICLPN